jgi:TRAP-type C4-dicarboxylate transport system permease small subunit
VDVLAPLLERRGFRWLRAVIHLAGAALVALMAWQTALYAFSSRSRGEATNMLGIALWPFELLTATSLALFCAVLLMQAWKAIR